MNEKFGYNFRFGDGPLIEVLFWTTKGRYFRKAWIDGVEEKTKRIGEDEYFSEWECYRNYEDDFSEGGML